MRDVRRAVTDDHPLGLLALVSSLLAVVDPRRKSPMERSLSGDDELTRDELVRSFVGVRTPETSALLAVIAAMSDDQLERARILRELQARRDPLPTWVATLKDTEVYGTVEMTHVLGDGDNVMVGARLPTGEELSVVVYIDHNLGTVAKDAFVVPESIHGLVEMMKAKADDPDMAWSDLDPAEARARISDAIDTGAITFPPFETDTWPACRPLVEWITRLLPPGGHGYQRPEWSDDQRRQLSERFFASPFAHDLGDPDFAALLDSVLWFGCDYGPGDPMRWSTVAVELLLSDWIPRKIMADASYLAKAPELLRAFVAFCHDEAGIRPALTAETLDAIDDCEAEYQRTIRSPRPQGPMALLAAMDMFGSEDEIGEDEPWDWEEVMLDSLRREVGGDDALDQLDDDPLPDEPFNWEGITEDVRERVGEVLELCDRACDEMLDVEYRTACRRFLARVASGDPGVFRRKARPETAAAAVCWVIGKANDLFRWPGGGFQVQDLMFHFGLKGSVSQRAGTLLKAAGLDTGTYRGVCLGSPALLVSGRRRRVMELRDRYLLAFR
jgi:hypothetical protein